MKKTFALVIAAVLIAVLSLTLTASADGSAVDAFSQLTNGTVPVENTQVEFVWDKEPAKYLDDVTGGKYIVYPLDEAKAAELAPDLDALSSITSKDIADYAAANGLPEYKVRNQYFLALATVVRAEIMVNPSSEDYYRNVQTILTLFLDDNEDGVSEASRRTIRSSMTKESAETIAASYNLPVSFVEFVIMDDDWNDDIWDNDDDWTVGADWTWSYDNTPYDNTPDYNTPDYNTPDYNTPDYNTPDYNTPDYNTPDYNTPDYNTPDYNTPDYDNSPD